MSTRKIRYLKRKLREAQAELNGLSRSATSRSADRPRDFYNLDLEERDRIEREELRRFEEGEETEGLKDLGRQRHRFDQLDLNEVVDYLDTRGSVSIRDLMDDLDLEITDVNMLEDAGYIYQCEPAHGGGGRWYRGF